MSLGSLTLAVPDDGDFMESLEPYLYKNLVLHLKHTTAPLWHCIILHFDTNYIPLVH
jgi:hypothetical protein